MGLSGQGGVLGGLESLLGNGGSSLAGQSNSFLNSNAGQILNNGLAGSNALMSGQFNAPAIQGAQVQAPSQNGINLSPTFQSLLGGGDTSALMKSLQAGNALAGAQFQQNQQNLTDNLQRSILPGIRGGAIAAGQYGGSRQGIAEGLAISDLTKQLNNSNTQFGLGATAANSSALANAYENGQNRALSAAQGLSGQQYGVASQDAAARQAADNTNVQALLATRGQNSNNLATGIGLQQGLLGGAANYSNTDLGRLGMGSGILAPFLGAGATSTNNSTTTNTTTGNVSQPLYNSTAGNALGGALLGSQLGGMFGGGAGGTTGTLGSLFGSGGWAPAAAISKETSWQDYSTSSAATRNPRACSPPRRRFSRPRARRALRPAWARSWAAASWLASRPRSRRSRLPSSSRCARCRSRTPNPTWRRRRRSASARRTC
ncbi:hypothetical protein DIR46_02375 [Massilia oculi]|uniref:Uncharacterized protein n=1 Tax=Massilia oculi TaxID=945844 RepID=A0A2S2DDI1_9BURK|nr:hypothetical protein DIR46_02375 [Massilia oculi]